jgi:TDG/mug DNA glycosylase family protein
MRSLLDLPQSLMKLANNKDYNCNQLYDNVFHNGEYDPIFQETMTRKLIIMQIVAFPPILPEKPHTLILGTMPGLKSLKFQQYYAHPQNQFWKFMGDIYGANPSLPYEERLRILKEHGIAVWDVVQACQRQGSMDADIKNEVVNDFEAFFQRHPTIRRVVFDSLTAEKIYNKRVLPMLTKNLQYARVPSPSPAHARMSYTAKLARWREVLL